MCSENPVAEPAEFAIYHLQKMLGQYGPLSLVMGAQRLLTDN